MGRSKFLGRVGAVLTLSFLAAACSDVAFSPAPLTGRQSVDNGIYRTETFFFSDEKPLTEVDVLFVVDNSGSMAEEAAKLSRALSSFVDGLNGVDWQIAITSSDVGTGSFNTRGRLVNMVGTNSNILTRNTPNYEQVFLNTVVATGPNAACAGGDLYQCGSGDEQPLEATRIIIAEQAPENAAFFRPGADLVSIILTDEDEMSDGPAGATSGETLVSTNASVFGGTKDLTGFGIIVQPTNQACIDIQAANAGQAGDYVQHFAEITNGETGSICDDDYGPALVSIGQRIKKYATTIALTGTPVDGSVTVVLKPADPGITWTVVGNTIRLSDIPKKGSRMIVTYERAE